MSSELSTRWRNVGPIRWPSHNYTAAGAYFLTICSHRKLMLFSQQRVCEVIESAWAEIPQHFPNVSIDVFVVMPNHVHGILVIAQAEAPVVASQHAGKLRQSPTLGTIVRSFKAAVTRELRIRSLHDETPVWQPSYYDRVVRNEAELNRIREYVAQNPVAWQFDHENPPHQPDGRYERAWGWLERGKESDL